MDYVHSYLHIFVISRKPTDAFCILYVGGYFRLNHSEQAVVIYLLMKARAKYMQTFSWPKIFKTKPFDCNILSKVWNC